MQDDICKCKSSPRDAINVIHALLAEIKQSGRLNDWAVLVIYFFESYQEPMRLLKIKSVRKRNCGNIHVSFLAFCHTKFLIIFVSPFTKSRDPLVRAQSVKQPLFDSLTLNLSIF